MLFSVLALYLDRFDPGYKEMTASSLSITSHFLNRQSVSFPQFCLIKLALAKDMKYVNWPDQDPMPSLRTVDDGESLVGPTSSPMD